MGVCHFFPALPAQGDVRHGCLRVFKHTLDSFFFFLLDLTHTVITVDQDSKQSQPKLNEGNTLQQCRHMLRYELVIRMNEGPRILRLPE